MTDRRRPSESDITHHGLVKEMSGARLYALARSVADRIPIPSTGLKSGVGKQYTLQFAALAIWSVVWSSQTLLLKFASKRLEWTRAQLRPTVHTHYGVSRALTGLPYRLPMCCRIKYSSISSSSPTFHPRSNSLAL